MEDSVDSVVCVVCQEPFDDDIPTATTPCNHRFHSTCFLSAALSSDRCPVCRASLYPEEGSEENDENEEGQIDIGINDDIEDTIRSIREEVSTLTNARLRMGEGLGNVENNVVIEINEPPRLRRSRLVYTVFKFCKEGNHAEVRRLISNNVELATAENDVSDTLLHQAVYNSNDNILRYLVNEAGVPVNSINNFRMTPLHYAVCSGVHVTMFMLNSGAYVDAQDSSGKTPLMSACSYNNTEVVKLLVDRGASTRSFDAAGDTCLHYAARGKCLNVLRLLLRQSRADPKLSNFLDETPLHLACATGSYTAVRFLLDSGADPNFKTKSGKNAVDYVPRENTRLPQLLETHS